jgi:ribosomal protein S18 acetylase RimI-like enzyme
MLRALKKDEPIPYKLLLLADEEIQAINRYIYQSEIYVVESENEIVGVCVLYLENKKTVEIKAIAVAEFYQNRGIGKYMLGEAATIAKDKGFQEMIIGTPNTAQKQIAIYEKAGFEKYGIRKDFFLNNYEEPIFEDGEQLIDMVMLRKRL